MPISETDICRKQEIDTLRDKIINAAQAEADVSLIRTQLIDQRETMMLKFSDWDDKSSSELFSIAAHYGWNQSPMYYNSS